MRAVVIHDVPPVASTAAEGALPGVTIGALHVFLVEAPACVDKGFLSWVAYERLAVVEVLDV